MRQRSISFPDDVGLENRHHVGVGVRREADLDVAEYSHDRPRSDLMIQQERCSSIQEIVYHDPPSGSYG